MKTILLIFSCLLLFCCTTEKRKVTTVHSPNDTVDVYAKDVTGQKIYNVISEKAVMDNGDPLFGKIRTEVPKQLNDKEFELAKTIVRKYIHRHQADYLPFDSYFQQYLGYKKEGVLMADVAVEGIAAVAMCVVVLLPAYAPAGAVHAAAGFAQGCLVAVVVSVSAYAGGG